MNKKNGLYLLLAVMIAAVLVFVSCGKEEAPEEEGWVPPVPGMKQSEENLYYDWKFSEPYPQTIPPGFTEMPKDWLARELENRTDGRFKMTIYYGSQLATQTENLELIGADVFPIGLICQAYHPVETPLEGLPWMPFWGPKEFETIYPLMEYGLFHPLVIDELAALNLYPAWNHVGPPLYKIWVREGVKEIKTVDDLKGLTARSYGFWSFVWKELGIVPIPTLGADAFEAIQKGMNDITISSVATRSRYFEVCDRVIEAALCPVGGQAVMNLDEWNKLPQYIKDIWVDIFPEFYEQAYQQRMSEIADGQNKFEEEGMELIVLPDYSKLEAAGAAAYKEWVETSKDTPSGKNIEEYLIDMIAYRDKLTGYHWSVCDELLGL